MIGERTKVELASYPKSGNSWLRHLLHEFLRVRGIRTRGFAPDIHVDPDAVSDLEYVRLGSHRYGFYKSHLPDNPNAAPDAIVYIYRHPLDVLLSAINQHARKGNTWIFLNGEPRTVEQIAADGELDFYFERFLTDLGTSLWPQMLGEISSIKAHTEAGLDHCRVAVRYEDLFAQRGKALESILRALDISVSEDLEPVFAAADRKTVGSGDPFFWRARARTREEFLSPAQIDRFERHHNAWLQRLGYAQNGE